MAQPRRSDHIARVAEPWSPERVVDAEAARSLVGAAFPDLADAPLTPLGIGFDNTAYLVGDAWVFRFPRRAVAVPLIAREARLLPAIAPLLPLAIPVPERVGRPSAQYPWPFAGYRRLPGRSACAAALTEEARAAAAEPLARFLAALHTVPPAEAAAAGVEGDTIGRMDVVKRSPKAEVFLTELRDAGVLRDDDVRRLKAVITPAPVTASGAAVLVHGDLYARHLLVGDDARLTGVIDWGDVHLGDRAVDLAIAHTFLPPPAREAFRRAYGPIDAATWARAAFRAAYHAAMIGRYALHTGDADLLREARTALGWVGR
jgi:aminoglycoside phosphotransferase (APT) family kinase protein